MWRISPVWYVRGALLLFLLAGLVRPACCQPSYRSPVDLGTLGGTSSTAMAINSAGQVVGYSYTQGNQAQHAFLYSNGILRDISAAKPSLDGSTPNGDFATGINDNGDIVGYRNYTGNFTGPRAFLYHNGSMSLLDLINSDDWSVANGINNQGQIVGDLYIGGGGGKRPNATIWTNNVPENIGYQLNPLDWGTSGARAINSSGKVVGSIAWAGFLWQSDNFFSTYGFPVNGINSQGDVVGTNNPQSSPQAVLVKNGRLVTLPTPQGEYTLGNGINAAGYAVGNSYGGYAFVYDGSKVYDLNKVIPAGSGWKLATAVAINDFGQIVGTGTNPAGEQHAFLLTPSNLLDHTQALKLQAINPATKKAYDVDGIVCDNLACMRTEKPSPPNSTYLPNSHPGLRNYLDISLVGLPNADIEVTLKNGQGTQTDQDGYNNVGWVDRSQRGHLLYYPPDEFNERQHPGIGDITLAATRTVYLWVTLHSGGTTYYVTPQPILLARPPLVLVHGINTNPKKWNGFMQGIRQYAHGPIVKVNHYDPKHLKLMNQVAVVDCREIRPLSFYGLFGGNGPIEIAADLLAERIQATLAQVRTGETVCDADQNTGDEISDNTGVDSYAGAGGTVPRLAILHVDVVGWSYGGVVARWYIAPKTGIFRSIQSQYNRQYVLRYVTGPPGQKWIRTVDFNSNLPVVTYRKDIRKVITLGSPWRGVPLANYVNEALFNESGNGFGNAPVLHDDFGILKYSPHPTVNTLFKDGMPLSQHPAAVPAYEVTAIHSKWLNQMIYPEPLPGAERKVTPFNEYIAYGSVAGDNNALIGKGITIGGEPTLEIKVDLYTTMDSLQSPSWFPYLGLEKQSGAIRNLSDGLMPVWTSAIPGDSNRIYPVNHDQYPNDPRTQEYVVQAINDNRLPNGRDLNSLWIDSAGSTIQSFLKDTTWKFNDPLKMAPYPQSDLYAQVQGVGRLDPEAWANLPHIDRSTFQVSVAGVPPTSPGKVAVKLLFKNIGNVLVPDAKITSAILERGIVFRAPMAPLPLSLGTIRKGKCTAPLVLEFDALPKPSPWESPFTHLHLEFQTPLHENISFDFYLILS